jgi:hypothetical protein
VGEWGAWAGKRNQAAGDRRPAIASKKLFFVTSEAKRSESFLFFAFAFDPHHECKFVIYIIDFLLFLFLS